MIGGVPHQGVDPDEIAPRCHGVRIVCRQVVEQSPARPADAPAAAERLIRPPQTSWSRWPGPGPNAMASRARRPDGASTSPPARTSRSPTTCCRSVAAPRATPPRPSAPSPKPRAPPRRAPSGRRDGRPTARSRRPGRRAAGRRASRRASLDGGGHLARQHHVEAVVANVPGHQLGAAPARPWREKLSSAARPARPVTSAAAQPSPHRQKDSSFSKSVVSLRCRCTSRR